MGNSPLDLHGRRKILRHIGLTIRTKSPGNNGPVSLERETVTLSGGNLHDITRRVRNIAPVIISLPPGNDSPVVQQSHIMRPS